MNADGYMGIVLTRSCEVFTALPRKSVVEIVGKDDRQITSGAILAEG
jgi:hypothetical protein